MPKPNRASQKNPTKAATKELSNNASGLLFSMTAAKASWAIRALLSKELKEGRDSRVCLSKGTDRKALDRRHRSQLCLHWANRTHRGVIVLTIGLYGSASVLSRHRSGLLVHHRPPSYVWLCFHPCSLDIIHDPRHWVVEIRQKRSPEISITNSGLVLKSTRIYIALVRRNFRQEQVRRGFNERGTHSTRKVGQLMLHRIMERRAAMASTHEQGQSVPKRIE
jgi:hypothetical protein